MIWQRFFDIHNKRVLIDVDGVCGKFHDKARAVIKDVFNLDIPLEAYDRWDVTSVLPTQDMKDRMNEIIAEPGFASSIDPYPEAQAAIREIRKIATVRFVTAPHPKSRTWLQERYEWLVEKFQADHREVIQAYDKIEVVGGMFIDDRPKNVRNWASHHPGRVSLLWDQPYNRSGEADGLRRVTSWDQVLEEVRKL